MKRRARRWLIAVVALAAAVGGGVVFYRTFVDPRYSTAELYADTGLAPSGVKPAMCVYEERPGHLTIALKRGKPPGTFSTEHASWEHVAVELPLPSVGYRIDLSGPGVRIHFFVYEGRMFWRVAAGGVRGYLRFDEVSDRRVTAEYDIVVAGYCDGLLPEFQNREFTFQGRSTFRVRPRPEGEHGGYLWPDPAAKDKPAGGGP